jgi:hypothetical protein
MRVPPGEGSGFQEQLDAADDFPLSVAAARSREGMLLYLPRPLRDRLLPVGEGASWRTLRILAG